MSKKKCFVIIGGFTEFIELYVRSIYSYGIETIIIDTTSPKYDELISYRDKNSDHFANLVHSFISISPNEDFLEKALFHCDLISHDFEIVALLPVKEKLIIQSAVIAEYLKLPSTGVNAAIISRSKNKQRKLLANTPWNIKSEIISKSDIESKILPLKGVIKPLNDHGSSSVFIWNNHSQLNEIKTLVKNSTHTSFLLEEKIEGDEYSTECWIKNGEILYSNVTKKTTLHSPDIEFPVEIAHELPYREKLDVEIVKKIDEMNRYVISNSGTKNAILHLEFKLDENMTPKVMEWAVRNPGDRIMDLYYYSGTINPYKSYVDILLDKDIQLSKEKPLIASQVYFPLSTQLVDNKSSLHSILYWSRSKYYTGLSRNIIGYKLDENITLHELGILLPPDTVIPKIVDSFTRHSYLVYTTKDYTSCIDKAKLDKVVENFGIKSVLEDFSIKS